MTGCFGHQTLWQICAEGRRLFLLSCLIQPASMHRTEVVEKIDPTDVFPPDFDQQYAMEEITAYLEAKGLKLNTYTTAQKTSARVRYDPNEGIGNCGYVNRAAIKLAELNTEFSLVETAIESSLIPSSGMFSFMDVCAGPGGFSEYMLKLQGRKLRGFGYTLQQTDLKFNMEVLKRASGNPMRFTDLSREVGDETGDIRSEDNQNALVNKVMKDTLGVGVHIFTADGAIDSTDNYDAQELDTVQLFQAECSVGLRCLATGGCLICKVFNISCEATVNQVAELYRHFERTFIAKPRTSRAANSERYVVCLSKLSEPRVSANIAESLFISNLKLAQKQDHAMANMLNALSHSDFVAFGDSREINQLRKRWGVTERSATRLEATRALGALLVMLQSSHTLREPPMVIIKRILAGQNLDRIGISIREYASEGDVRVLSNLSLDLRHGTML